MIIVINIFLIMYALVKIKYMLNIYQQSNYQIKSYTKHFINNMIYNNLFVFLFFLMTIIAPSDAFLLVIYSYFLVYALLMYKDFRKPLVITNRIKRQLLLLVLFIISILFINDLLLKTLIILFIEFFSIVILYISNKIEHLYSKKFIRKAALSLNDFDKNIYGISGSYGKTSVKHFLGEVLNTYESTLYTKKSFNTPLGISICLNETNLKSYENIILEYGASKVGDTKYLLNKFKPTIGILTSLGNNHLDTFKSFENIVTEETLVINTLKENEVGFINYEDETIRNVTFNTKAKLVTIGINYGDYRAKNIKDNDLVSFDVYHKDKFLCNVDSKLIGKHNVINLLMVVAIIDYFNYDLKICLKKIKQLDNVDNRLSIKKYDDHTIISDAFNSNLLGSLNALKLLRNYEGKRFLITTTFADMKKAKDVIDVKYSKEIAKSTDVCILVGFNESKEIYKLIDEKIEVYIVDTIDEAFKLFYKLKENHSYLLIDNDLPDIYLKRSL